jgi:hypothetical protein
MAKATFDIKSLDLKTVQVEAQKSAERVFFAGVGVTDRAVEVVRDYVAGAQKKAQQVAQQGVAGVQKSVSTFEPKAFGQSLGKTLTKDAKARRTAIEKRVADLQAEALAVPGRAQQAFDANLATATAAYADLVKRGETLVGRIRRQQSTQDTVAAAETTVAKAKTTKTQATKAAKKRTAATRSSAKATSTAAKKTVSSAARALNEAAQKIGD